MVADSGRFRAVKGLEHSVETIKPGLHSLSKGQDRLSIGGKALIRADCCCVSFDIVGIRKDIKEYTRYDRGVKYACLLGATSRLSSVLC
jgi:hypothetical protein